MQDGLPYQFHMRVEAIDEAGNIGTADTREIGQGGPGDAQGPRHRH